MKLQIKALYYFKLETLMAYFHCRTRIQIRIQTQIPNPMAT